MEWYGGRPRPGHIVLDGMMGTQLPNGKGTTVPPLFGPCLLWPKFHPLLAELLFDNVSKIAEAIESACVTSREKPALTETLDWSLDVADIQSVEEFSSC